MGFLLWWLLLFWSIALGAWAVVVGACGLSSYDLLALGCAGFNISESLYLSNMDASKWWVFCHLPFWLKWLRWGVTQRGIHYVDLQAQGSLLQAAETVCIHMRGCGIAWGNAGPRIPKWVTSAFPLASFNLTQKSGAAMAQFFSLWNGGHCRLLLEYTNLVTEVCYSGVLGQKALGMEEMNMVWGGHDTVIINKRRQIVKTLLCTFD